MAHAVGHQAGHGHHKKKMNRTKVLMVAAVVFIVFLPSFIKYQELGYKNRKLEERLIALGRETRRLEEEKRRLETDITYVEKRAREEMGLVRKGEIVLKGATGGAKR